MKQTPDNMQAIPDRTNCNLPAVSSSLYVFDTQSIHSPFPYLRNAGAADPDTTPLPPFVSPSFSAPAVSAPDGTDRPGLSYSHCPATRAVQQKLRDTNVSTAQFGHSGLSSPRCPRHPRAAEANIPPAWLTCPGRLALLVVYLAVISVCS